MNIDLKITPKNLLADWGEFEDWESGESAEPTGWTKTGTPTIAREATIIKHGTYSLKLIGGGSGQNLYRAIDDGTDYQGRTMSLGVWVYTAGAGVTVTLDDGVGTSNSSAHTGGGGWEWITVTRQIDSAATKVQATLNIPNGVTAYFDGCVLVEGETLLIDLNSSNYMMSDLNNSVDIRYSNFEIARKAGIHIPNTMLGAKTMRFKGDVVGATATACRTNFDALVKMLMSWKENEKRDFYIFDDRVKEIFLSKFGFDPDAAFKMKRFDVGFIAPDPSWRYISMLRKAQVISSSPTSFNLVYNGNIASSPVVYFVADQGGDITSCTLENLTTGESFSFSGTVASGDTLKVDCNNSEVENDAVDSIANWSGDFIKLVPGTNYLKFTGSLCRVRVDWFDRWL